jgi:mannose-6-phosphate isomerase-like protein (cupin superfamily)
MIPPSPFAPAPLSFLSAAAGYRVGDHDDRPWGRYVVTACGLSAAGEEFCEKKITIAPLQVLSLQSHELRRETWRVRRGALTALCDGKRIEVLSGETIRIPKGSVHCMANLGDEDCVVEERQEGVCREEDIRRYMDVYQRDTETLEAAAENLVAYRAIINDINKIKATKKNAVPY